MGTAVSRQRNQIGIGQLSLVEHALCPLDPRTSLVDNLVFDAKYAYTPEGGRRQTALARIFCPLGLSAADELYLWGLLSLTLAQPDAPAELFATPHWCLRQLGMIDHASRRGGRQYRQFSEALRRLSAVTYISDGFYDPIRGEHRRVSLRFFSYSLPCEESSGRAWQIAWDPIFFKLASATAGHLRFDLSVYRQLDPASRRLFLFASKVLPRCAQLKAIPLQDVGTNLLGFSSTLTTRQLTAKVRRCLDSLSQRGVLSEAEVFRTSPGRYFVRMSRGPYFATAPAQLDRPAIVESPLLDPLVAIGFDNDSAARLIRKYPPRMLAQWIDITQAASERFGPSFFKRSPMAFLVDSVSKAAAGERTAPDWWHKLRRAERQRAELTEEGRNVFARIRSELFGAEGIVQAADGRRQNTPASSPAPLTPLGDVLAGKQTTNAKGQRR